MHSKLVAETGGERTFVLILNAGEDAVPARQRRGGAPYSRTAGAPSRHPVVLRIDQNDGDVDSANPHVSVSFQHRPKTE
jgi:hypothetical protein